MTFKKPFQNRIWHPQEMKPARKMLPLCKAG